ncbi:hypothetical protein EMIHUDRAFT_241414 [Emiliania huxleyi CCMP1516]|uniref:Uncharacterized protein n=2 Tax=Emiliania huxleyi TaxID=2903 RepID=A0A0D3JCQ3_EMIH1|nr:hypothetical protein EMIHUDRAFT_241414 [Emiliania huxleyi CCMP1516]EOD21288.1 hypothetical protein EMIHUDRAFT_241414 [Emiliania huxleyi CCMP1516]|eukprot:XP_005773717.1 hypothetical protein EMIHUDRAFT_241414 [Emiliania huxleyi CCMP1516]
MPFAQQGGSTGVNFASQGADTALHFFTDPNFDFQKEGQKYQQLSGETGNAFGGLWQDFMNMGIHTGIAYAGAGADTATEWGNGKGDGAATANKFGALSQTTGNNFNTLTS